MRGVGPLNLVITNDALYQLSYTSEGNASRRDTHYTQSYLNMQALILKILRYSEFGKKTQNSLHEAI